MTVVPRSEAPPRRDITTVGAPGRCVDSRSGPAAARARRGALCHSPGVPARYLRERPIHGRRRGETWWSATPTDPTGSRLPVPLRRPSTLPAGLRPRTPSTPPQGRPVRRVVGGQSGRLLTARQPRRTRHEHSATQEARPRNDLGTRQSLTPGFAAHDRQPIRPGWTEGRCWSTSAKAGAAPPSSPSPSRLGEHGIRTGPAGLLRRRSTGVPAACGADPSRTHWHPVSQHPALSCPFADRQKQRRGGPAGQDRTGRASGLGELLLQGHHENRSCIPPRRRSPIRGLTPFWLEPQIRCRTESA